MYSPGVEDEYAKIDYSSKLRAHNLAPRINEGTSVRRQEKAEFGELEQFVREGEKKQNFESTNYRCTKVSTIKWGLLILSILVTCTLAILFSLLYLWVLELKQEVNVQKAKIQCLNDEINSLINNGSTVVQAVDGLLQSEEMDRQVSDKTKLQNEASTIERQEKTTNDQKVMMEAATKINQLKQNVLMEIINSPNKTISEKEEAIQRYLAELEQVKNNPSELSKKVNEQKAVIDSQVVGINRLKNQINELAPEHTSVMLTGGWTRGTKTSTIIYNSMKKSWKNCKLTLPITLAGHGAAVLNNEIYIFGGYDETTQETLKSLYKLGAGNKWEKMADMSEKRGYISQSSVVFNSEIWVIGGTNGTNTLKSVEKFNPKTKKWIEMPELNEWRTRAAATVIDGKIYVSGGWGAWKTNTSVEVYDPEKGKWEIFTYVPDAIHSHILIGNHSHLIIIGNDLLTQAYRGWKMDVLDPKRQWEEMPYLQQKRFNSGAAIIDDELMVFGGSINNRIDSVEIFDGVEWKNGAPLPEIRDAFGYIPLSCRNERHFFQRFC